MEKQNQRSNLFRTIDRKNYPDLKRNLFLELLKTYPQVVTAIKDGVAPTSGDAKKEYDKQKSAACAHLLDCLTPDFRVQFESMPQVEDAFSHSKPIELYALFNENLKETHPRIISEKHAKLEDELRSIKQRSNQSPTELSVVISRICEKCKNWGMNVTQTEQKKRFQQALDPITNQIFLMNWDTIPLDTQWLALVDLAQTQVINFGFPSNHNTNPRRNTISKESTTKEPEETPNKHVFTGVEQNSKQQPYNKFSGPIKNPSKQFQRKKQHESDDRNQEQVQQPSDTGVKNGKCCNHCLRFGSPAYKSHTEEMCRYKKNAVEWMNKRAKQGEGKPKQSNQAYTTVIEEQFGGDEEDFPCFVGLPGLSEEKYNEVCLKASAAKLDREQFLYDTACTVNVFNDPSQLEHIWELNKSKISGIGGSSEVKYGGYHWIFGEGVIVEKCPVNLISHHRIIEDYLVQYDNNSGNFIFNRKDDSNFRFPKLTTEPINKLQVFNQPSANELIETTPTRDGELFDGFVGAQALREEQLEVGVNFDSPVYQLHFNLDHPNMRNVYNWLNNTNQWEKFGVTEQEFTKVNFCQDCPGCRLGKSDDRRKLPSQTRECKIGERLHADIAFIRSAGHLKPILMAVDERTNYLSIIVLKNKHHKNIVNGISTIKAFYKQYGHDVKFIHTDSENTFSKTRESLLEIGIELVQTGPGVHERKVERMVRTVRDRFRATLYSLSYILAVTFYILLFRHVTTSINYVPNKLTGDKSPYELVKKQPVPMHYVRFSFGSYGSAYEPEAQNSSEPRASLGICVGRDSDSSTIQFYRIKDRTIVKRVNFKPMAIPNETIELLNNIADNLGIPTSLSQIIKYESIDTPSNGTNRSSRNQISLDRTTNVNGETVTDEDDQSSKDATDNVNHTDDTSSVNESADRGGSDEAPQASNNEPGTLGGVGGRPNTPRSRNLASSEPSRMAPARVDRRSGISAEGVRGGGAESTNSNTQSRVNSSRMPKPSNSIANARNGQWRGGNPGQAIDHEGPRSEQGQEQMAEPDIDDLGRGKRIKPSVNYERLHRGLMSLLEQRKRANEEDPTVIKAVEEELVQMKWMGVFTFIKLKDLYKIRDKFLPCRMLVTTKRNVYREVIKVKARLVAGGNFQDIGDFDISSPTVRFENVMFMLNIAAFYNYRIDKLDVGGAYLEAHLEHPAYVHIDRKLTEHYVKLFPELEEYVSSDGKLFVKLNKAMYGLREAAKAWYEHLTQVLSGLDFIPSTHDAALLTRSINGKIIHLVAIHVDDILSIGEDKSMDQLIKFMESKFQKITFTRNMESGEYLNMEMIRNRSQGSITLRQPGYIEEIVEMCKVNDIKEERPYRENLFQEIPNDQPTDANFFRSVSMKMMYATRLRPDIKLPVIYLSTKMQDPKNGHLEKLKRVGAYLNATKNLGITF